MKFAAFGMCALAALSLSGLAMAQDETEAGAAVAEEAAAVEEAVVEETVVEETVVEEAAAVEAAPVEPAVPLPAGISPPPEGKGQVVFFRPSRFVGGALSFTVRENEVPLGRLPNGRYFVHVAEPGIHAYEIGNNDTMRMEIEPGETYFAIQSTQMGVVAGRAVLSPSDQAAFEAAVGRMRVSNPIEPGAR